MNLLYGNLRLGYFVYPILCTQPLNTHSVCMCRGEREEAEIHELDFHVSQDFRQVILTMSTPLQRGNGKQRVRAHAKENDRVRD